MSISSEELMLKKASSMLAEAAPDPRMTQMIIDHPLYPLLKVVYSKCELATISPRNAQSEECTSDSFSEEIRNFINTSPRNIPLTTGDYEVDKFMLKSIEVLRIHLLELEKVHQLCDNFCQRYIGCLKGKLPIDVVREDGSSSRDTNSTSRNGNAHLDQQQQQSSHQNNNNNNNQTSSSASNTTDKTNNQGANHQQQQQHQNGQQQDQNGSDVHQHQTMQHHHHQQQQVAQEAAAAAAAAYHHHSSPYGAYGPAGYGSASYAAAAHHAAAAAYAVGQAAAGMPHAHYDQAAALHHAGTKLEPNQHNNNHHNHHQNNNNNNNHHQHHHHHSSGSSSASSVKLELANNGQQHYGQADTNSATTAPDRQLHDDVRSPTGSTGSFLGDASLGSGDGTECEDDDNRGRRQQKKRGIFPKAATNTMRQWLFQHLNHPYPSEDQKKQLAEDTGLTILQVNNWFINARRRIVQPMIDQSNRTSGSIMAGPGYSPDGMSYVLGGAASAASTPAGLGGAPDSAAGMSSAAAVSLASHAAMQSAMGAYGAQHLSQYGRSQHSSHAAMLGLSAGQAAGAGAGAHLMGAHPTLPPHEYY